MKGKVVGDPDVEGFLKKCGLEAWTRHLTKHLDLRTTVQVQAITAKDLRRMATSANMRLDQKTIDRVLGAIKREGKPNKNTVPPASVELLEEAFEAGWTLEMDAALVNYASERARVKGMRSAGQLQLDDLFDHDARCSNDEEPAADPREPHPDRAALRRGTSRLPQYTTQDVLASLGPVAHSPGHLEDMTHKSIQERWKLLKEYNALVEPALLCLDLRQFDEEGSLAHTVCVCKGRILPDTKNRFIEQGIKMTESDGRVPDVSLTFPMPDSKEHAENDSVFEQLFKQLHGKASLRTTTGEGRLWRTGLTGTSQAMWTDGTDAGGMFRSSVAILCSDLRQPVLRKANSTPSLPLLVESPNFALGEGEGEECLQNYIPNPQAWLNSSLKREMEDRYHFLGQLMGASARTKGFIEIDFPSILFKFLLHEHIGLREIREIDAQTAGHLAEVRAASADEQQWSLKQSRESEAVRWRFTLVDGTQMALRGDGTEAVDFSEITDYIAAVQSRWFQQFKPQLTEIRNGFFSCFPPLAARLLTWRELQRRVCGVPDVSVDALKRIARYEGTYSESDSYIHNFWEVLKGFTGEQRQQFLGFVWGRTTLPMHPTTPFVIDSSGGSDDSKLPTSHTCMFQLHLPRYSSTSLLRKMVLLACASAALPKTNAGRPAGRLGHVSSSPGISAAPIPMPCDALTSILRLPKDAGHKQDCGTLWRRAGLSNDMAKLVHRRLKLKSEGPSGVAQLVRMHRSKTLDKACHRALVDAITTLSPLAASERRVWKLECDRQRRARRRTILEGQIARLEALVAARESSAGAPPEGQPPRSQPGTVAQTAVYAFAHADKEAKAATERIRKAVIEAATFWPDVDDDLLADRGDRDCGEEPEDEDLDASAETSEDDGESSSSSASSRHSHRRRLSNSSDSSSTSSDTTSVVGDD